MSGLVPPSQSLASFFAALASGAERDVLLGLAGPLGPDSLVSRMVLLDRAASSSDPVVLSSLVGCGDPEVLRVLLGNGALALEDVAGAASVSGALAWVDPFAAALSRLPFDVAFEQFEALRPSSPLRSARAVVDALVSRVSPSCAALHWGLLAPVLPPVLVSSALWRLVVSVEPAEAFLIASALESDRPAEALAAVLHALEGGFVLDAAGARLVVRLVRVLGEEVAGSVLDSLEWVFEGAGDGSVRVSAAAAEVFLASGAPVLESLSLLAPFDEARVLRVVSSCSESTLHRVLRFPVSFRVVEAVAARVPGVASSPELLVDAFFGVLPGLGDCSGSEVLGLLLGVSSWWCGSSWVHREFFSFLAGGWSASPPPGLVGLLPPGLLLPLGAECVALVADGGPLVTGGAVAEVLLAAPGALGAWLALPPSPGRVVLGQFFLGSLVSLLGSAASDSEVWELVLGLADGFDGSVRDLVSLVPALSSSRT